MAPTSELTDRYELGEPLGVGGTATVFRATRRDTGRQVAVKIVDARLPQCPPGHRSEAAALAELNHPGLVGIDEVGVHDGCTYLVMRLVEGEPLSERIARGPLPTTAVGAIGARLADTLSHVHGHGVVHRDVKPSNVLLDADELPHLTDFGVSKLVDATRITATGSVVGTPAYMAPEQVRGQEVGSAADVYALGLVLIEALTGLREFPGSVVESAVARLHRDPRVPRELPAAMRTLLTAMTAQDPAHRPAASTVARTLASPDAPAVTPAPPPRRGPAIARPVRIAAGASVLVTAAAVAFAVLVPSGPAPVAVPAATAPAPAAAAPVTSTVATPISPSVAEIAEVVPMHAAPVARPAPAADAPPGSVEEPADRTAARAGGSTGGDEAEEGRAAPDGAKAKDAKDAEDEDKGKKDGKGNGEKG